jgi:hypothetical protein
MKKISKAIKKNQNDDKIKGNNKKRGDSMDVWNLLHLGDFMD